MKKIGEIKGVPVVEGNINEVTKNQIHYKEDSGSIQLSKRGNDNKLNSVTGSSSGGNNESGGILYLKYNGNRYYTNMEDNPMSMAFPVIAGVTIYNAGATNDVRSYTYSEIYGKRPFISGFGEMAIPKMNSLKLIMGDIEIELNTTSKENITLSYAKALANLQNIDINEVIPQVEEWFKDYEECSEEEFYKIFNQYKQ